MPAVLERQLVAHLLYNPEREGLYPQLNSIITDSLAKASLLALKKGCPPNAIPLAKMLSTKELLWLPETVQSELLSLNDAFGLVTPEVADRTYRLIEADWIQERSTDALRKAQSDVAAGRMTLSEAGQALLAEASELRYGSNGEAASTHVKEWTEEGKKAAEEEERKRKENRFITVPNDFPTLQSMHKRIDEGILVSFLGRTGSGKTAMAQAWAHHLGRTRGKTVVYFTTELTKKQLMWRWYSRITGIPYEDIASGLWNEELAAAAKSCAKDNVVYVESAQWTTARVLAFARRYNSDIVIDYHGMLSLSPERKIVDNGSDAIGESLGSFKAYAQESNSSVYVNWLPTKEAAQNPILTAYSTRGGANAHDRSNMFWLATFPLVTNPDGQAVPHPFDKNAPPIRVPMGKSLPVGYLTVEKNTFGSTEGKIVVWMEGKRFRLQEVPTIKWPLYYPIIDPYLKPIKKKWGNDD